MSFLSPWFLALGVAAAVPLLLHLLRRRIGARVEFPAARYLARAEREHSRTLRLRNLLLMVARVAAVLLIALAAARPAARLFGGGHGPTAMAVVLDNSLSTAAVQDGRPLFAHLDSLAERALSGATTADRVWLVTADGQARAGTAAELRDAVRRISPLGGAGDPALALARAASAVRNAGLAGQQVALITDAQRTTWTAPAQLGAVPVVAWVPAGAPPANRAVVSADAQPQRWTPRGAVSARLMAQDSTTYRIALAGSTLARGTAAPGEEILVRATPAARGWLAGTVELDADELPGDNVRYFAAWVGAAPRVRVAPDAGPFVASAVDVLRGDGRVAAGGDVTVAPADEVTALPALITAPTDPVRLGAANRALARAGVPWQFGPVRRGAVLVAGDGAGATQATLRYSLLATGAARTDTLARAGAEPWIVAGPGYVLVASPLTPDATTLPVSAGFVPWLAGVFANRLSGDPGRVVSAAPIQHLIWPSWAGALDGAPGAAGTEFTAPDRAGTYFFTRDGRRVGALVVNPEPRESELARWAPADFARLLGGHARAFTDADRFAAAVFDVTARRPVVVPLLAALLAVLVLEGAIAARGAGGEG
ncbi:MAG TPA: VWA domain-containing protein [Gemmatimonadaceae bacterium]|nr:VWA domain-containing protein [Gemmatimonadaceae bacterium]